MSDKGDVDCEDISEHFLNDIFEFANVDSEEPVRRLECKRCGRPSTVCWCPFLSKEKIEISTTVFILQHPFEELRKLRTAPILYQSLGDGKCHIIRGKKFGTKNGNPSYPGLREVLCMPNTVLLFPGEDAVDITELPALDLPYNLLVLDGTWAQAKEMYSNNAMLRVLKKVSICSDTKSKYVIHTQPTYKSLSTLESVAVALSILEQRPELANILTAPLEALCQFQLHHGAVEHQSKEFRIANGLWLKPLSRKILKKMERENGVRTIENISCGNETEKGFVPQVFNNLTEIQEVDNNKLNKNDF